MTGWLARGEDGVPLADGDVDGWLDPAEAGYARSLRFTKRRTEFLLRRWTAKHAVAAALGVAAGRDGRHDLRRVAVLNRPSGAPYVLVDGEPVDVDVSVTDRAGWAVCLVGAGASATGPGPEPVGVDLELVEPRSPGFVTDFLTAAEADAVRSLPDDDARDAAANLLWSAKESTLKVLRTGLRADTRTVEVSLTGEDGGAGWSGLSVRHTPSGRVFPGWWRRDGAFVLTTTTTRLLPPPAPLPGSADLAAARPVHSWVAAPLVPGAP